MDTEAVSSADAADVAGSPEPLLSDPFDWVDCTPSDGDGDETDEDETDRDDADKSSTVEEGEVHPAAAITMLNASMGTKMRGPVRRALDVRTFIS